MNYRHSFHAGNFADLVKHALVLWLLKERQERGPVTVIDTHAGAGLYDLAGTSAMKTGEAEAGILSEEAGTGGLEAHPFRIDRLVVVAPRGHALAERSVLRFAEVLEEDFVGLPAGNALSAHLSQQAARLGHVPRFRVRLRGVTALARMVEAGVGIAVLPEIVARRCQREMALAAVPLADPWALRRLMLCVRRLDALPVHARRLVEHLIATGPEEIAAPGHGAA